VIFFIIKTLSLIYPLNGTLTNEITSVKNITTNYSLLQIHFHKTTKTRLSAVATAQAGNHATRFSRQVDWGL